MRVRENIFHLRWVFFNFLVSNSLIFSFLSIFNFDEFWPIELNWSVAHFAISDLYDLCVFQLSPCLRYLTVTASSSLNSYCYLKKIFCDYPLNQVYFSCFRCNMCSRQLVPGEEFALLPEGLICGTHIKQQHHQQAPIPNDPLPGKSATSVVMS